LSENETNLGKKRTAKATYAVIIPCKDGEKTITETLNSVLSQTLEPTEVIVVDDASRDRTPILLRDFPSVRVMRLKHNYPKNFARVPKLINMAMHYVPSNCDYVMLLGDDSTLEKDYVEKLLLKFRQDPHLKIASGDMKQRKRVRGVAGSPQGSGRIIDMQFLNRNLPFPESIGWESWILFRGMQEGGVATFPDVTFEHKRQYGTYSIRTFGHSMYVLGYPLLFAVARSAKDFLLKAYSSRFHSLYLLLGYAEFCITRQRQLDDVKSFVQSVQKARLIGFLRRQ
jgi:glycosyltransferase involved in cell wall biosynthesis